MTATNDFLLGSSATSAFGKDDPIGTSITGQIVSTDVKQQTDIATGNPLTWDNGDPKMQLVVTLKTEARDPQNPDDDGTRVVYVKGSKKAGSKSLHDAVAQAVRAANAKGIEPGGTLGVTFVGTEPSATRGFNDRKLWTATYKAPDVAAATGGYLGTDEVNTATGEITTPPATPAAGQPTAEQVAALQAAGVPITQVYPAYTG